MQIDYQYARLERQHSKECMCRLRNIAMTDFKESVTTGQTDTDGLTNRHRTKLSLCAAMLRRRHKNWHKLITMPSNETSSPMECKELHASDKMHINIANILINDGNFIKVQMTDCNLDS